MTSNFNLRCSSTSPPKTKTMLITNNKVNDASNIICFRFLLPFFFSYCVLELLSSLSFCFHSLSVLFSQSFSRVHASSFLTHGAIAHVPHIQLTQGGEGIGTKIKQRRPDCALRLSMYLQPPSCVSPSLTLSFSLVPARHMAQARSLILTLTRSYSYTTNKGIYLSTQKACIFLYKKDTMYSL